MMEAAKPLCLISRATFLKCNIHRPVNKTLKKHQLALVCLIDGPVLSCMASGILGSHHRYTPLFDYDPLTRRKT